MARLGIGKSKYLSTTTLRIGEVVEREGKSLHTNTHVRPHLRRGHIRNQRYGANLSLSRQVFIEAVFVNADEGWIAERTSYSVVKSKQWRKIVMFDKTYITPQSGHSNVNVSVKEIRAPTDDSMRLLREIEEAVQKKIVASMQLDSNFFKAQIAFNRRHQDPGLDAVCYFNLNEETYTAKFTTKYGDDAFAIAKGICEAIAHEIYNGPIMKILVQVITQDEILKSGHIRPWVTNT